EALDERAVRLVDQPLRLGGDRPEDKRALARARHPREHGEPTLRDVEVDIPKVVLAGTPDLDRPPIGHGQPAAFFTSSTIRFSAVGVSSITANSVAHISPSSR